ncbi:hypothetical protein IEQ34_020019 [Dendrobium chrysotoxum]|uniref:Ubiquitin-like protease family profile domain-containing protein n=1 Tax=Dendrobium chrysotoxum TaxID=161865 RepID=A0AAV7GA98_DENCH|nr:hypothetical protein IEQ34_020019 [Dendrobium chrysotoxum]
MSDTIYTSGDIIVYRSQIDKLLKSEYLDTNHIDTFGNFLVEKSQLCPSLYEPFLFVSSLYWIIKFIFSLCQAYHAFKVDTTRYISYITKESVSAANLMLVPIIEQSHWTLLVGNLKIKVWDFYDSLPKKTHIPVIPEVIFHIYEEIRNSFETDIRV